ncbi:hypothetical protein DFH09DRAFT_1315209 [Mycena vulgaris]|nr:hypothetical protein DFH09DRAFT_1315209 [Mycena vulgaris]
MSTTPTRPISPRTAAIPSSETPVAPRIDVSSSSRAYLPFRTLHQNAFSQNVFSPVFHPTPLSRPPPSSPTHPPSLSASPARADSVTSDDPLVLVSRQPPRFSRASSERPALPSPRWPSSCSPPLSLSFPPSCLPSSRSALSPVPHPSLLLLSFLTSIRPILARRIRTPSFFLPPPRALPCRLSPYSLTLMYPHPRVPYCTVPSLSPPSRPPFPLPPVLPAAPSHPPLLLSLSLPSSLPPPTLSTSPQDINIASP